MTRFHAFVVTGLVSLVPSAASAVVMVNVEQATYATMPFDQVVYLEAFLTDLDNSNERLNAFTLALDGVGFSQTGVRFLPQPGVPTAHPYVFKDFPGIVPEDMLSTPTRFQTGAGIPTLEGEANVSPTLNGLVRIPLFIPANFQVGASPVVVSIVPHMTESAFGWQGAQPILAVAGPPGGLVIVPEPAAAALALVPALALRRRRRAA
jgi:hypothetical protein